MVSEFGTKDPRSEYDYSPMTNGNFIRSILRPRNRRGELVAKAGQEYPYVDTAGDVQFFSPHTSGEDEPDDKTYLSSDELARYTDDDGMSHVVTLYSQMSHEAGTDSLFAVEQLIDDGGNKQLASTPALLFRTVDRAKNNNRVVTTDENQLAYAILRGFDGINGLGDYLKAKEAGEDVKAIEQAFAQALSERGPEPVRTGSLSERVWRATYGFQDDADYEAWVARMAEDSKRTREQQERDYAGLSRTGKLGRWVAWKLSGGKRNLSGLDHRHHEGTLEDWMSDK